MGSEVTQFGSQLPISPGATQIPYQEETLVIAAGASIDVFRVFNYFRVLSLSGGALSIRFGQNGIQTPFTGQGVGLQLAFTVDRLTLVNTGGASMTLTYATALGQINDDRLNVSSALTINSLIPGTGATELGKAEDAAAASGDTGVSMLGVRNDALAGRTSTDGDYGNPSIDSKGAQFVRASNRTQTAAQTSVGTSAVQLVTANAANNDIIISAGTADLYVGTTSGVTTANGFLIPAGGSLVWNSIADLYGIRSVAGITAYSLIGQI